MYDIAVAVGANVFLVIAVLILCCLPPKSKAITPVFIIGSSIQAISILGSYKSYKLMLDYGYDPPASFALSGFVFVLLFVVGIAVLSRKGSGRKNETDRGEPAAGGDPASSGEDKGN